MKRTTSSNNRTQIIIALIGVMGVIVVAVIGSPFLTELLEGSNQSEIPVTIRVSDNVGASLTSAKVMLFFPGGPLSEYTDTNGTANFTVRFSENVDVRLVVETNQYEIYEREIQLPRDNGLDVRLEERPVNESSVIIRVVDNDSSLPISGAEVLLLAEGEVYPAPTDSNGIAKFTIGFPGNSLDVQMSVKTENYEVEYQNVTLLPNRVQDIRLNPITGDIEVLPFTESISLPEANVSENNTPRQAIDGMPIPAPLGWAYEQDGIQLNLVKAEIRTDADSGTAASHLWFALLNKSAQRLLIELNREQIYIVDSLGTQYIDNDGPGTESFWLESGQSRIIERFYTLVPGERSRIPPSTLPITVVVDTLSRIQGAQWIVGDSPFPTYTDGDSAGSLASSFNKNDFQITLNNLEIRTTSDSSPAAFRAWFSIENTSNQRKLLDTDYAHIFIEDSFGNRYIDYDGVGLISTWIDPGEKYEFDRYYSLEYDKTSRVPIGTLYVVIISEGIGNNERIQWRIDITR